MQQGYGYGSYYGGQPGYQQYPYAPAPAPGPYPGHPSQQSYYYPSPPANVPFPSQPQVPQQAQQPNHRHHPSTSRKTGPLKSVLKPGKGKPSNHGSRPNSAQGHANGPPLTRVRTGSGNTSRTSHSGRSTSSRAFVADHIFVTFHGDNQIEFENLQDPRTLDLIKEGIIPLWAPGAEYATDKKDRWIITFFGNPWASNGYHPRKIVQQLFKLLARQHWYFTASVSPANPKKSSPRMCFARGDAYSQTSPHFIPIYFTNSGWTINVIEPTSSMPESIDLHMKVTFPKRVKSQSEPSRDLKEWSCTISPSSHKDPDVQKALLTARLLQIMRNHRFDLIASVPLGTSGLLGLSSKKEVWIFCKKD